VIEDRGPVGDASKQASAVWPSCGTNLNERNDAMTCGKLCIREVDLAEPHESVQVAARRMHSRKVGTLVVVDGANRPVGLLTDRDLAVRVLAEGLDPVQTTVREAMSPSPTAVSEETTIEEALRIMRRGPFRRLPVVNSAGKLVGLLSLDDILDLLSEEFADIGQILVAESPVSLARN